jgi:putative ATP-dependent endonuclease of OLD family
MPKIVHLSINNYRIVKALNFAIDPDEPIICLIGRGDSGKTTILDAIAAVLSPAWNMSFQDTDFYQCDPQQNINIEATIIEIPPQLQSVNKFGLHMRAYDRSTGEISDNLEPEEYSATQLGCLTVRLQVDQHLEPKWQVTNLREHEDKLISGAERSLLNCHMVADHIDKHFSWNKGNPLYSLLRSLSPVETSEDVNIIVQTLRDAKKQIDQHAFAELKEATALITRQAGALGLNIANTATTLDFKEISIRDDKISLHEDLVPFRLKGKGSKRLISMAIQLTLLQRGGIMLVDEIEQGLEPDRVRNLIQSLKEDGNGQVFLTTHSRDVIMELGAAPLAFVVQDKAKGLMQVRRSAVDDEGLVKAVRACPDAFFARKVIVCEGKTEIGICRALDNYRKLKGLPNLPYQDCAYVDGAGKTQFSYAKDILAAEIQTLVLVDSDRVDVNQEKEELKALGIKVIDCQDQLCIEAQVFNDLPWEGVLELFNIPDLSSQRREELQEKIMKYGDSAVSRQLLIDAATNGKSPWFKRIDYGEKLGDVIFNYLDELPAEKRLKIMFDQLNHWIDA